MVRAMSANATTALNTQYGTEPLLIVEIQWEDAGQVFTYADRKLANTVLGQLVDISSIDDAATTNNEKGLTNSTQVSMTIDDSDGYIKTIFDSKDFHKSSVWIYQWFDGLALADKFLIFKGQINTPIIWSEGDRTVTFDVTTKIEDVEAGFSMEEGDFPLIPASALGKAWPLVFGTVCDVPAVQVRTPREGVLQAGEGIRDYTLESRICQAEQIMCPQKIVEIKTEGTGLICGMYDVYNEHCSFGGGGSYISKYEPDTACVENRLFTVCNLWLQLIQQKTYEHSTFEVLYADTLFPQNKNIIININGGKFKGYFTGTTFHVNQRLHPEYFLKPASPCYSYNEQTYTYGPIIQRDQWEENPSGTSWRYIGPSIVSMSGGCEQYQQTGPGWDTTDGAGTSQDAYDHMNQSSFFWIPAGSKVYLEDESEVLYIISLLPGVITRVAAMRSVRGQQILTLVPPAYYTPYLTDYTGYTVTELTMPMPLSQRQAEVTYADGTTRLESEGWSDEIYVTLVSSIGPNPVDIITWLIGKYAPSLTIDTTSFNYVKSKLTKYPANFALMTRKNVLEVIGDIAKQSRCIAYIRPRLIGGILLDIIYLKYYSEEPASVLTLDENDILANSLKIDLTQTENVYTKNTITWGRSKAEGDLKIILKYNVAKYGTKEQSFDYYISNIYDNILKSSTFWMIRDANVWKQVKFNTTLKYLNLETFDCITLDLGDLAPQPVTVVITGINYDIAAQELNFTCWTPLRAGESLPYIHAWPANIPATTIFPTADERLKGLGYTFTVTPPVGHLLYTAPIDNGQPKIVLTSGDPYPSDLDDTLEVCSCLTTTTTESLSFNEPDPVFLALKAAQQANKDAITRQEGGGTNASFKHDENKKKDKKDKPQKCEPQDPCDKRPQDVINSDPKVCVPSPDDPDTSGGPRQCGQGIKGAGCIYEVSVLWLSVNLVEKNQCEGGPCAVTSPPDHMGLSAICTDNGQWTRCYAFGSRGDAEGFQASLVGSHCPNSPAALGETGQTIPYLVGGIKAINDPCPCPAGSTCPTCDDTSPGGSTPGGTTTKPDPLVIDITYKDDGTYTVTENTKAEETSPDVVDTRIVP